MNIFSSNFLPYPVCSNRIFLPPRRLFFSPSLRGRGLRGRGPVTARLVLYLAHYYSLLFPFLPPPNPPQSCFFLLRPQPPSASERRPPPSPPARKAAYFPRGKEKILRRFSPFPYTGANVFSCQTLREREVFQVCAAGKGNVSLFLRSFRTSYLPWGHRGRGFCGGKEDEESGQRFLLLFLLLLSSSSSSSSPPLIWTLAAGDGEIIIISQSKGGRDIPFLTKEKRRGILLLLQVSLQHAPANEEEKHICKLNLQLRGKWCCEITWSTATQSCSGTACRCPCAPAGGAGRSCPCCTCRIRSSCTPCTSPAGRWRGEPRSGPRSWGAS